MVAASTDLWSSLPTYDSPTELTGALTTGQSFIQGVVLNLFLSGSKMQPQGLAYAGDLIMLTMSLASAAYVVVKTVDACISFSIGFAHQYRYGHIEYDNLG